MTTLTRKITLRSRDIEVRYAFPDESERTNAQHSNIDALEKQLSYLENKFTTERAHLFSLMRKNYEEIDQHHRSVYNRNVVENTIYSEITKRRPNFTFESVRLQPGTSLTYNGHTCYVYDSKNKVCIDGEDKVLLLTLADAAKRVNPNAQSGTSTWRYNGVLLKDIPV